MSKMHCPNCPNTRECDVLGCDKRDAAQKPPTLFHPCVADSRTGRHSQIVGNGQPRLYDDARAYLEKHYPERWFACEATPQPVDHPYFKDRVVRTAHNYAKQADAVGRVLLETRLVERSNYAQERLAEGNCAHEWSSGIDEDTDREVAVYCTKCGQPENYDG